MEVYLVDGNNLEIDMDNGQIGDPSKYIITIGYCIESQLDYLLKGIDIGRRWDDIPIPHFIVRSIAVEYVKFYIEENTKEKVYE